MAVNLYIKTLKQKKNGKKFIKRQTNSINMQ